jgi:superfamily II DNA or RNA helicase
MKRNNPFIYIDQDHKFSLRDYQHKALDRLRLSFTKGNKKVVLCAPTGSGKTVMSSYMCRSAAQKGNIPCVIVHRRELMRQFTETLVKLGVNPTLIESGKKYFTNAECYVAMVETMHRRLKKNPNLAKQLNIGLFVVDECHNASHFKILDTIPNLKVIGLTATPICSQQGSDLRDRYNDIVISYQFKELIEAKALVPAITYSVKHEFKSLVKRGKDFTSESQQLEFRTPKLARGAVENWILKARGKKTLCYNIDVAHSKQTCQQFQGAGVKTVHCDAKTPMEIRDAALEDFSKGNILVFCNVEILTTGFDEPTVECIIQNRATSNLSTHIQMLGRGARPCPEIGKTHFVILDMGRNFARHGMYGEDILWEEYFLRGGKKSTTKEDRLADLKLCNRCNASMPRQNKICLVCGYEHTKQELDIHTKEVLTLAEVRTMERKEKLSQIPERLRKRFSDMDHHELREYADIMGYKPGWVFYQLKNQNQRVS